MLRVKIVNICISEKRFQLVVTYFRIISFLGAVCDFIQKALCHVVPSWQALSPGGNAVYVFDPSAPIRELMSL